MSWVQVRSPKLKSLKRQDSSQASTVPSSPEGMWHKCRQCGEIVPTEKWLEAHKVCPKCQLHSRLSAVERMELLFEEVDLEETFLKSSDPLDFIDRESYREKLNLMHEKTGRWEGTLVGLGKIQNVTCAFAIMDFFFMGGSMGVATGESICRAFELGMEKNVPVLVVSASGGARMQEGLLSLMQMAKTSSVRQRLKEKKGAYISLLTDPTTGGVAASFSTLGDLNIAEPGALIGFAGPRVIEQSIRQTLPPGFQRAEFLLEHGQLDQVIHRHQLKKELHFYLEFLGR
jgi:acetyl-CoA carboxylase carboxyl transferase subunit beta